MDPVQYRFQYSPCSDKDFVPTVTHLGMYYTFNSGSDSKVKTVHNVGLSSGLDVMLDAK